MISNQRMQQPVRKFRQNPYDLNTEEQSNLFVDVRILREVPYRRNQKNWKPLYKPVGRIMYALA